MKPETRENVLLGAGGAVLVLIGFLVAAGVAQREAPRLHERITIMKVRPVPIATEVRALIGSPRCLQLIFE